MINRIRRTAAATLLSYLCLFSVPSHGADTLTVYTYESFTAEWGPGPLIKTAFENQCDCTLNFVAIDSSAGILNRVQLEGSSSKADVVLGLDYNLMAIAEESNLLDKSDVDLQAVELPVAWDSDIFVPFDYGHFAFVYDTEAKRTSCMSTMSVQLLARHTEVILLTLRMLSISWNMVLSE